MIIEERYEVYYDKSGRKRTKSRISCERCLKERIVSSDVNKNPFCKSCSIVKRRHSIEQYKELARTKNLELISKEIKTVEDKVMWKCQNNHIFLTSYVGIYNAKKNGCAECQGNKKKTLEDYLVLAKERGIVLLNEELKGGVDIKHNWLCKCGREWEAALETVKKCYCQKCMGERKGGENHYKWNKDRESMKIREKCSRICRSFIYRCLNYKKDNKTLTLLGYNPKEFRNRIESTWEQWMNWKNHGAYNENKKTWQVDHIKAVKDLLNESVTEPRIINALSNLRALETKENIGRYYKKTITQS